MTQCCRLLVDRRRLVVPTAKLMVSTARRGAGQEINVGTKLAEVAPVLDMLELATYSYIGLKMSFHKET